MASPWPRYILQSEKCFGNTTFLRVMCFRVMWYPKRQSIHLRPLQDNLFSSQRLMCTIHTRWRRAGRWVSVTCFLESWEGSQRQNSMCCRLQLPIVNNIALHRLQGSARERKHAGANSGVEHQPFHLRTHSVFPEALTPWILNMWQQMVFKKPLCSRAK